MIRAVFYRQGERLVGFECDGHAGQAEAGFDIVCAAVSALTVTCVNAVEALAGVKPITRVNEEVGYLSMQLPDTLTEEQARDCSLLINAVSIGLNDIAHQYPDFVRVTDKDRRSRK